MIDKIKVGDVIYNIKDTSVSDQYRTSEQNAFKTANDYTNNGTSLTLTSNCTADSNMILSIKEGYKFSFTYHAQTYSKNFGWYTDKIVVPKGKTFSVSIAKEDDTTITTEEHENLLYETFDEFYDGEYNEKNVINNIHFITSSIENGAPEVFNGTSQATHRIISAELLRFDHEVKVINTSSQYGFSIQVFDKNGTKFISELDYVGAIWAGTRKEAIIPANTPFRIYARYVSNANFGDLHWIPIDASNFLQLEVNTCSGIVNQTKTYELADNNYYGKLKSNPYKRLILEEWADFNTESLQSVIINTDEKQLIKIDGSTTAKFYDFNGNNVGTVTKSNTVHDNDACYVGSGYAYIVGAYYSTSYLKSFFRWNITTNVATSINLSSITNNSNGSYRVVAGVCETYRNSNVLYIVCADWYNDGSEGLNHQEGDKLSVYTYNISTGAINLEFETEWDCVYVQGATCLNDILYVACNTQTDTSASNYKGITIKMFDTKTWTLIDEVIIEGNFEPESINYIIENGTPKLAFGLGKYGTICKLFKMELPQMNESEDTGYSTTEQKCSTWIDGKNIYRKVITVDPSLFGSGEASAGATYSIPHGIGNIDMVTRCDVYWKLNGQQQRKFPSVYYNNTAWSGQAFTDTGDNGTVTFELGSSILTNLRKANYIYIVLEYTKTTD